MVVDGGDEARETCDTMRLSEEDADDTEAALRDGDLRVYADGAAERFVEALAGRVCALRVEAKGEAGDQVDELTKCPLNTRDTEDSSWAREG